MTPEEWALFRNYFNGVPPIYVLDGKFTYFSPQEILKQKHMIIPTQTAYKDLNIWQKSFALTPRVYEAIASLPECESRNLAEQMRRSVTSIPLNIAEGASSQTGKLFLSHLKYAYASSQELEAQLMICARLKYIDEKQFIPLYNELDSLKMALYKFIVHLERKQNQRRFGLLDPVGDDAGQGSAGRGSFAAKPRIQLH
jgi:four helix bundle protein